MKWKIFFSLLLVFSVGLYLRVSSEPLFTCQLSDNNDFLQFCRKAAYDEQVFHNFKRNPIYNLFYENVTYEEGRVFLNHLVQHNPELLRRDLIERVRKSDWAGRPHVYSFDPYGPFSPTVLLHFKIAGDIKRHFKEMKDLCIIEIGGGSGSLCRILHEVLDVEHYTIIALDEEVELIRKHLKALGLNHVQFCHPSQVKLTSCDLLISNQTFTESSQKMQKRYTKKLFQGADRGYLICNHLPKGFGLKTLPQKKLLQKAREKQPAIKVYEEVPDLGKKEYVMAWGI